MNVRAFASIAALLCGCSALFNVDGYRVATQSDAGPLDPGHRDAATGDAGQTDAGSLDAGTTDAGETDAGIPPRCTDISHRCDLVVSCSMPSSTLGAGETIRVPWQVSNLGAVTGAGPFVVRVEMDHEGTLESVGEETYAGILPALGSENGEVAFVAPAWIAPGENELRCTVDPENTVPEVDDANNEDASSVVATGLPDLDILYVSIPGNPEDPFPVTFDIQNDGATSASVFRWAISGGRDDGAGGGLLSREQSSIAAGETVRISESVGLRGYPLYGRAALSFSSTLGATLRSRTRPTMSSCVP